VSRAIAGALAALVALAGAAHAREPIELAVLTYNIHGLPGWIAGDDPPARIPPILERAAAYDVVLLQEDFAYHDVVRANARHPHVFRGNGAWAPLLEGSGLTVLSRFDAAEPASHAAYAACSGYVGGANDCLGTKGFLHARVALANGASLDVWNTHLDAGRDDADRGARAAQLDQLAREIATRSEGRALLVGGDLNLDWDDARDRALLAAFRDRLGLAIAAQTPENVWESRLDYLLVRSAGDVTLEPVGGGAQDGFVDGAGAPLSDHPAIAARIRAR
jgi:endonuclease/exonuclease/phosphatase family metal-dependent hydrolase